MNEVRSITEETLSDPVLIPVEAYVSEDYVRAERDRLWRKTWQQVGRVEDLPEVGNYITYEILDDSILIVRTGPDEFQAHHNVCLHRGRKLVDTPRFAKHAKGKKRQFVCGFHGWRYGLDGQCTHIASEEDWKGKVTAQGLKLGAVKVDHWGGFLFINMDPDCEPLRDYLEPAASLLDPFQLENMRYRWRRFLEFDCNWKVAMEAFAEIYHVETTHPEFMAFGEFFGWGRVQGKHSNIGYDIPKNMDENQAGKLRVGSGKDARISTAEMQVFTWENVNTNTTRTMVEAAKRLVDELPEGTPAMEVLQHWLKSARADDEKRGVIWPTVDPAHVGKSGTAWQIFPNFQIGHAVNNALVYCARPSGYDPNKCFFEAAVLELFPAHEVPETEWEYIPADDKRWGLVLAQDFSNMAAVQQGMKSMGFPGTRLNPYRERSIANLHRNLSEYMGTGNPEPID